jgi:membrane-associated protease RseP (regulator of RpoE activity)
MMMLQKNMGAIDRAFRIILGALLIIGAIRTGQIWMWIGVVPLVTGLMNSCPLYSLLGIKTRKTD